jgi:hypothetical protein
MEKETRGENMNWDEKLRNDAPSPLWQYVVGWAIILLFAFGMLAMVGTLTGCAPSAKPESTQICPLSTCILKVAADIPPRYALAAACVNSFLSILPLLFPFLR